MTVTESDLVNMVQKHVRMDMSVKSSKASRELQFTDYKSLLRQHGTDLVTKNNQKVAVPHILSVMKLEQLKNIL